MAPTRTEHRQRIDRLRERKTAARDRMAKARRAVEAARKINDTDALELAEAEYGEAHDEAELTTALELSVYRQLSGGGEEFGRALVDNIEAQGVLRELAGSTAPIRGNVTIGPLLTLEQTCDLTGRALMAAPVVTPDGPRRGDFLGIPPTPVAPTRLLDVFRSAPFEGNKAEFMRRQGGVADAAIQVEGAIKQEAALTYTSEEEPAYTIASWSKVNRQSLDDIDGLLEDLRIALQDGVMLKVESLMVTGAPPGPTGGITTTTGILAPTLTGITNLPDAVGQMKAQLAVTGVEANFCAAHPITIEAEEVRKDTAGQYVQAIDDQGRVRRLPLVPTNALPPKHLLVGDSRIGAALGVRSPVSIVVGQSDDDLQRNRVTVLCEGRWAALVAVPGAFAHGTLP